jgi:RNA-directed DNA polymerase
MTERGHRITRYADDFVICCKTLKGAQRVLNSVVQFLEQKLGLKVHPEKTKIVDSRKETFVFLGYVFWQGRKMFPSDKAKQKFKERTKEITRRNQTVNVEQLVKKKLNPFLSGWGNYFAQDMGKPSLEMWTHGYVEDFELCSSEAGRKSVNYTDN